MTVLLGVLFASVQVIYPKPAPGPLDNPLKGWCPYTVAGEIHQPYSMVFLYVPWNEIEPQEGVYRFDEWERRVWSTPLARGKHVVFRVVADYPGRPSAVPRWLIAKGVKVNPYDDYGGGLSPDYDDSKMVSALERLIAALGHRYDRNPRVAFVQFGLLGFWGEWHTYPRTELFASDETQRRVLEAARRAFPHKIVMTRYPEGFAGHQSWLGFFDDSFPDDTGGPEDWKFLQKVRRSGRTTNWERAVVGGEMLPRQASVWLGKEHDLTMKRLEEAHFSWVGPYCPALEKPPSTDFLKRSQTMVRKMGYEFRLTKVVAPSVIRKGVPTRLEVEGVNDGVAPFYYRWPVRLALIDFRDRVLSTAEVSVDIRSWLPGRFRSRLGAKIGAPAGHYRLAIGVIDPWTNRPAIRFANRLTQVGGWTVLSGVQITP
jgi:hypothetical protein